MSSVCQGCGAPIDQPKYGRRKWCSDRCRKQTLYSRSCEDCGAPTTGDGYYHRWCGACNRKRAGHRSRERWLTHRVQIEAMWADGHTTREICAAMGLTFNPSMISQMRYRGYDLPHRRTREQIARMTADKGAHIAKARRVWAEMREAAHA